MNICITGCSTFNYLCIILLMMCSCLFGQNILAS